MRDILTDVSAAMLKRCACRDWNTHSLTLTVTVSDTDWHQQVSQATFLGFGTNQSFHLCWRLRYAARYWLAYSLLGLWLGLVLVLPTTSTIYIMSWSTGGWPWLKKLLLPKFSSFLSIPVINIWFFLQRLCPNGKPRPNVQCVISSLFFLVT